MTINKNYSVGIFFFAAIMLLNTNLSATDFGDSDILNHPKFRSRIKVLNAWIEERVENREQPGLSIGIIYNGELIWTNGYGYANLTKKIPATSETIYRIGSLSKVFTAMAIMHLRDLSLLNLDDEVSHYLTWFKVHSRFANMREITIRDLLTHRSGLPFDAPGVNWIEYSGPSRDQIIENISDIEVIFPAGEHKYYSNLGYWILGEIVSTISTDSCALYVEKNILSPLGMSSTTLIPNPFTPDLAIGYGARLPGKRRKMWQFTNTGFYTPAGDGASNIKDMARLISFFMMEHPGKLNLRL